MKNKLMSCILVGCITATIVTGCQSTNSSSNSNDSTETTEYNTGDAVSETTSDTENTEEPETTEDNSNKISDATTTTLSGSWEVNGDSYFGNYYTVDLNSEDSTFYFATNKENGKALSALFNSEYDLTISEITYSSEVPELDELSQYAGLASIYTMIVEFTTVEIDTETIKNILAASLDAAGIADFQMETLSDFDSEYFDTLAEESQLTFYKNMIAEFDKILPEDKLENIQELMEDCKEELAEASEDGYLVSYTVSDSKGNELGQLTADEIQSYTE
jgi:hypothetical protein